MSGNRTVLRSWLWNVVGFAALGLMAVAALATVDSTTDRLVQAGFLGMCVLLALIAVRFLFSRVIVRPEGLLVAGAVRSRRIPREAIRDVTCEVLAGGQLLTAFTPVVHLVDGKEVELNQLAGYSQTAVEEHQRRIKQLLQVSAR
ncbi:hypothetical protein [Micromonospora inositola]|uniref:PH domain-containing protein n=1 Tax=Micromonospora inositola TaxID=47865 RepID=A0A1C5HEN0_9ACTN|nr:hypothetical protein [Micromonospora inositola]SCG44440.1 hypothetical protein GA0070613_1224 [Micromonospora inositola]